MELNASNAIFSKYPGWWYVDLMDNIPVGIFRTTLEGKIIFCNKTFATIFGFKSRKELTDYKVINLYRNNKNKGDFIKAIMARGHVEGLPVPFKRKDGTSIWCAVTAEAIFQDEGIDVFLDGIIRDITGEIERQEVATRLNEMANTIKDFTIILDLQGNLRDINGAGANLLGIDREDIIGQPLLDFISPRYGELFRLFISDIIRSGREEGLLTVMDSKGQEHHLDFHAFLVKKTGKPHHIKGIGQNVTERIKRQREQLSKEKFRGVLEMAGGVAHRLNQPLTIVNNLIRDILADLPPNDQNYQRLAKVFHQIQKLNELSKKISGIKKYESTEYVGGIKIFDIDRAS